MRPVLRTRIIVIAATVGVAVLIYSLLGLLVKANQQQEENERLRQADLDAYARIVKAEEEALRQNSLALTLQKQIEELGERPVVAPEQVDLNGTGPTIIYQRPSREQIVDYVNAVLPEALRTICGGTCKGADGSNGTDGQPGQPGQPGSNGADGRDGRGISSLSCTSPAPTTFVITYSDGETSTVTCSAVEE